MNNTNERDAVISQMGSGWPMEGDVVTDGETRWRVVRFVGQIQTRQWQRNTLRAVVVEADDEGDEVLAGVEFLE